MSNTEYRVVIKFFIRKGLSATETAKELAGVYDHSASSPRTVAMWVAQFKDPARVFEDAPRSGQPSVSAVDESVRAVEEVVMRDRQISVRRIADKLDSTLTKSSVIIWG